MNTIRTDTEAPGSRSNGAFKSFQAFLKTCDGLFDTGPQTGRCISMGWLETPLGPMLAGADSQALRFLDFCDSRAIESQIASLRRASGCPIVPGDSGLVDRLKLELDAYFAGSLRSFTVPVDSRGSPFQNLVWQALSGIPYGETRSYGDLARSIGNPGASRAVGSANGSNRVLILIPCHRVINANGQLGGFGGGLDRKRALLELEGRT